MAYIHPVWDSETERLGKRRCAPVGRAFWCVGEIVGLTGHLALLIVPGILGWKWLTGTFEARHMWLFAIPPVFIAMSQTLHRASRWLFARRNFHYDPELVEASWVEGGQRVTFRA